MHAQGTVSDQQTGTKSALHGVQKAVQQTTFLGAGPLVQMLGAIVLMQCLACT